MFQHIKPELRRFIGVVFGVSAVSLIGLAIQSKGADRESFFSLLMISLPFSSLIALLLTVTTAVNHRSIRLGMMALGGAIIGWVVTMTITLAIFFCGIELHLTISLGPRKDDFVRFLLLFLVWNLLVAFGTGTGAIWATPPARARHN